MIRFKNWNHVNFTEVKQIFILFSEVTSYFSFTTKPVISDRFRNKLMGYRKTFNQNDKNNYYIPAYLNQTRNSN